MSRKRNDILMKLIACCFLIASTVMTANIILFLASAISSTGEVVSLVPVNSTSSDNGVLTTYAPSIVFTTKNGQKISFTSELSTSSSNFFVGQKIPILYLPNEPKSAKINNSFQIWMPPVIVGVFGVFMVLVWVGQAIFQRLKNGKRDYFLENGKMVLATFKRIYVNEHIQSGDRNPHKIITEWCDPLTNKLHVFNSETIWFYPNNLNVGDEVKVYIETDNPKKYWMDISFIPKPE